MATYTVKSSKHATPLASTIDTVKFTTRPRSVELRNLSSSSPIFYSVDGTAPTVSGDDTYRLGPNKTLVVDMNNWVEPPQVQLISSARRCSTSPTTAPRPACSARSV